MDIARCLLDGKIYEAHVFSQLPMGERETKRQELICPNDDCKGPAYFRREARSGQAACFGARHVDSCNMAAAEPVRLQGAEGDEEDYLFNPGDRLEIDLGYGAHVRVHVEAAEEADAEGRRRAARYVGDGARPNAVKRQRLQPLLRTLILHPRYAEQDVLVGIPGRNPVPARELFVPFEGATDVPTGNFYALWGLIASARYAGDTLWLNAGGKASVSFPMNGELQATLQERLDVNQEDLAEELAGCYLLVLGNLARGGPKDKLYCPPESEAHIAVIRA
jgi:hypothetical protein